MYSIQAPYRDVTGSLDDVFGSVRSIILTSDPIPDVKFAFVTLSRDESYRNSNMTSKNCKSGLAAFTARNTSNASSSSNNKNRRFGRVSNLVCKHCNMTSHTIDRCFELVGYPPGFKKNINNKNTSNNVSNCNGNFDHNKSASPTLTNDQYQRLMALLSGTCDTSKGFASVVVSHPNGTIEHVKQIGNYVLRKKLIAKDVLVVPGYHESTQRHLMGTGSEKGGLYFFDEESGINDLNFFDENNDSNPKSDEPYDDGGGTELDDENYESEGEDIKSFGHLFGCSPEPVVGQTIKRSSRKTSLSTKYQDYVLDKNVKYSINTVANYYDLSIDNYVFATSINKVHDPTTYQEAVKDNRWI
ncbi:hypothetical protein Tco_1425435 [Tanacetum coccineum]